jgi:hypothetical protein
MTGKVTDSRQDLLIALRDARAAEQAVSEILKIISRSPDSLDDLFDTILDNALQLCDAELGILISLR